MMQARGLLAVGGVAGLAAILAACGGSNGPGRSGSATTTVRSTVTPTVARPQARPRAPFAVGIVVLRLVDSSRRIAGRPRTLVTIVRYPALGGASKTDVRNAPPATAAGPFPLVVFAHGYRLAPYTYTELLRAWTRAGYVVAAPYFPLTNEDASVVERADIVNQPQDLRFVIARLQGRRGAPLQGVIDGNRIALGGHSDGVDSALAVIYSQHPDEHIRAALGFSGGEVAAFTGFSGAPRGIPLLAVQGTADSINTPSGTYAYFAEAPRPKYLLRLLGAEHTSPYQDAQPYLGIVERVSTAFLNRFVAGHASAGRELAADSNVPGEATLQSYP